MNIQEFNKLHESLTTRAKNLIHMKNKDYGATTDVLSNFKRISQRFGESCAMGLLYRIEDKIGRIHSFSKTSKYAVQDEKVEDTIIDLINYSIFLAAVLKENKNTLSEVVEKIETERSNVMSHADEALDMCKQDNLTIDNKGRFITLPEAPKMMETNRPSGCDICYPPLFKEQNFKCGGK